MAKRRQKERWEHTAWIAHAVANWGGMGAKQYIPAWRFNPFRDQDADDAPERKLTPAESMALLDSLY